MRAVAEGRVFRHVDGRWDAIGDPLPAWGHAPPRPGQAMAVWILPKDQGSEPGDIVAFAEVGHRLVARLPADDAAWGDVVEQALATAHPEYVREWVAGIELWLGMRLDPGWR